MYSAVRISNGTIIIKKATLLQSLEAGSKYKQCLHILRRKTKRERENGYLCRVGCTGWLTGRLGGGGEGGGSGAL